MTIGLPVAVRSVAAPVLVSRGATPPEPTASNTAGGAGGGSGPARAATDTAAGSGPRQTDRRAGPRRDFPRAGAPRAGARALTSAMVGQGLLAGRWRRSRAQGTFGHTGCLGVAASLPRHP